MTIKTGMIRIGFIANPLYDHSLRSAWENRGMVVFKGTCILGHGSAISTGKNGSITIGDGCLATALLKLVSYKNITIGSNMLASWENIIMDTDFHETINCESGIVNTASKQIKLGDNNWLGLRCVVLKGTVTANNTIVAANTTLNKNYADFDLCVLAGNPAKVVKRGLFRDLNSVIQ